jgi:hypothetical protein
MILNLGEMELHGSVRLWRQSDNALSAKTVTPGNSVEFIVSGWMRDSLKSVTLPAVTLSVE